MSVPDMYLVNDGIYRVLENGNADANGTVATSMFTVQQILDALNRVQQEFLVETGAIITLTTIAGVAGSPKYALPTNSMRPRRVTWKDNSDNIRRALSLEDTWVLDTGEMNWPSDRDIPIVWWETTLPQQTIAVARTPINNGNIGVLYVAIAATLDGTGVALTVPDDFTPYILWGALEQLFGTDGPPFDPVRAEYCGRRFDEGIELAKLILGG